MCVCGAMFSKHELSKVSAVKTSWKKHTHTLFMSVFLSSLVRYQLFCFLRHQTNKRRKTTVHTSLSLPQLSPVCLLLTHFLLLFFSLLPFLPAFFTPLSCSLAILLSLSLFSPSSSLFLSSCQKK